MWVLPLIGYIGVAVGFSFLTLAIASGLYYLSELVEEHTVLAKKLLTRLIYLVIILQILLKVFDGFPLGLSALSVGSHVVYMQNLRRFPVVKLTDLMFLLSCGLVLLNHYAWFKHFQRPPPSHAHLQGSARSPQGYYYSDPYADPYASYASFTEIASYFGLCVWLVPFSLFIALSAGENVLPSMGSEYATGEGSSFVSSGSKPGLGGSHAGGASSVGVSKEKKGGREGLAKAAVNRVREYVSETGEALGFWKGERTTRTF